MKKYIEIEINKEFTKKEEVIKWFFDIKKIEKEINKGVVIYGKKREI